MPSASITEPVSRSRRSTAFLSAMRANIFWSSEAPATALASGEKNWPATPLTGKKAPLKLTMSVRREEPLHRHAHEDRGTRRMAHGTHGASFSS